MRWAIALGWLLAAADGWADAPMDLRSPFLQTALIEEKTGEIVEKTVRKGQRLGEIIELEKEEGGLLVLPRKQVVAILPRLPTNGVPFLQIDAQRAIQVLQEAQTRFPRRPEVRPEVMAEWQKLGAAKNQHDEAQSDALDQWLKGMAQLSSEARPDELEKIRQEANVYLHQFPDRAKEIEGELKLLRELDLIDLDKTDSLSFEIGPLAEGFWVGGILWALLVVPLVVALKFLPEAIPCFRERMPVAGAWRFLVGTMALAFLAAILWGGDKKQGMVPSGSPTATLAARKAAWFCLNHQEKWANMESKKISLPASEWLGFLQERTAVGAGSDSFPYWHLARAEILKKDSSLVLFQPVEAKFITLPFRFLFDLPDPGQSWTDLQLIGAFLGRIPLGGFLGQLAWDVFRPSYQLLAEKCGLQQGVRWLAGSEDTFILVVPRTQKTTPKAKDSLTARELAEVFEQGFGEIYEGRLITVEGDLVEVSSIQETLGDGTKLDKQDPMDEFTLEGIPQGPGRRYAFRVRCQFKSSEAYFLDSKGDLYRSAPQVQNPAADIPVLRRLTGVTKVRLSSGRVESKPTETRLITLYDCRKVEGFDGKEWVTLWEN